MLESITSKIFNRITNSHNLSKSQQQTQATDTQEQEIIKTPNNKKSE